MDKVPTRPNLSLVGQDKKIELRMRFKIMKLGGRAVQGMLFAMACLGERLVYGPTCAHRLEDTATNDA